MRVPIDRTDDVDVSPVMMAVSALQIWEAKFVELVAVVSDASQQDSHMESGRLFK